MRWVLPSPSNPLRPLAALRMKYAVMLGRRLAAHPDRSPALLHLGSRLAALLQTRPDSAVDVLLDPSISVLIQCGRVEDALPLVAVELALRGLLGAPIGFTGLGPLWSSARDFRLEVAHDALVTVRDDGLEVTAPGHPPLRLPLDPAALRTLDDPRARGSAPFPRVGTEAPFALALADANPLFALEAHPEKQGNAISLGGHDASAWRSALEEALALVRAHLPGLYAEMALLLRLIVPVGYDRERHLSASYREYVGAIYVTLHPNVLTMAEAVIHEFQHNKLNLLAHSDPLLLNGAAPLYRSPLRPDPRPLMGLLLAAHAFVPVAEFYDRVRQSGVAPPELERRLADVLGKNDEAIAVLRAHAQATPTGRALIEELEAAHARYAALPRRRDVTHEG